jgi:hypothetical protein
VKGTKTQISKKEGRESKNPDTRGSMRSMTEEKFQSIWGERMQKKEKLWRDLDVGTRREKKTGIRRKERKEGAECAMRGERDN